MEMAEKYRILAKRWCLCAVSVLLWAGMLLPAWAAVEPINAKAVVLMEAGTGRVLYAQNEHKPLPMASTTKIMTALLALEQPDIHAVFPVDPTAIQVEGSSMGLQAGDVVSLRALAAGMLLASGNDGANAAAVRIAGSQGAFAVLMNQRAQAIGMADTYFVTPSGLDNKSHVSTAYDMALLAREALRNPEFAALCGQDRVQVAYGNPPYDRWLTNHNRLLKEYDGAIGVKTGFTTKAGRCLVSAARREGITLICVTLACPDDWAVHRQLYDDHWDTLAVVDAAARLPEVSIPVTGGILPAVGAVVYEAVPVTVSVENPLLTWQVRAEPFLYAPIMAGQYVGEATVFLAGQPAATLTLAAEADVPLRHAYEEKAGLWGWICTVWGQMGMNSRA